MAASPRLSRGSRPQVEILAEGARGNIITPRIDSSRPKCTAAAEISATRRSKAPAATSNTAGTAITTRTTGAATVTTAAEAEADTMRTGVAAVATKTIGGDGKETLKGFLQRLQLFTDIWTAFKKMIMKLCSQTHMYTQVVCTCSYQFEDLITYALEPFLFTF